MRHVRGNRRTDGESVARNPPERPVKRRVVSVPSSSDAITRASVREGEIRGGLAHRAVQR